MLVFIIDNLQKVNQTSHKKDIKITLNIWVIVRMLPFLESLTGECVNTMSKELIIAEKPSVAADIAKALGGFTKTGDYYESDGFVLSSAVGHLLELIVPEGQEVKDKVFLKEGTTGEETIVFMEDKLLYDRDIDEGSIVVVDQDGRLQKAEDQ